MVFKLNILYFIILTCYHEILSSPLSEFFVDISKTNEGSTKPSVFKGNNYFQASEQIFNIYINSSNQKPNQNIPGDYEIVPGIGAYKFHPNTTSWNDARKTCIEEGANLPVIRSPAENEYIKKANQEKKVNSWLGLHDLFENRVWATAQGESLASVGYAPWRAGEPNNAGGNEHCVHYVDVQGMNDLPCEGYPQTFYCKIDLE